MASSQTNDSTQFKTCRCGEGDKCIWTSRASESSDNQSNSCPNCEILKNGPLFISSKGIGWTSWKKRWFVLSRTSLMFYRADPNTLPQKGNEAPNPTLGGIELNNSGSVVVKPDKKLLTVLFPDGRDGRAFTLKTETLEELNEWKAALESALAQAPNAAQVMGQNGIFRNEVADSVEASVEQCNDKPPSTSSVIGRPVILALEDIDGSPSFLEKALRFIEEHGIKVEGILRQSADVEEVVHRVQEYEQGKNDFSPDEDARVIGDCIKHVLREMPSSPVPASCCTALVDAYRTDRGSRINDIRDAIYEIFPEPNYRLLQRILQMMLTVAAHKAENRMSLSALAACMAPLLLRPLLAGECELKNDFQMDDDGSFQLLQAAAAANHAQAIVIILLEEYEHIFDDESFSSELYTESEDDGEDIEGDESTDNDIPRDDGYHDAKNDLKVDRGHHRDLPDSGTPSESCSEVGGDVGIEDGTDLDSEVGSDVGSDVGSGIGSDIDSRTGSSVSSDTGSDVGSNGGCVVHNAGSDFNCDAGSSTRRNFSKDEGIKDPCTHSMPTRNIEVVESTTTNLKNASTFPPEDIDLKPSTSGYAQLSVHALSFDAANVQKDDCLLSANSNSTVPHCHNSQNSTALALTTTVANKLANIIPPVPGIANAEKSNKTQPAMRNKWGRTSARKNLSMESIEYISDDESVIQSLESTKIDLQTKISKEIEGNAVLQANLDKRKEALHERRLALQKEVVKLQEQLKKERALRLDLESGLRKMQTGNLYTSACLDSKTRIDLEEIALTERDIITLEQNITDLNDKLHQDCATLCESCGQPTYTRSRSDGNKSQKNVDDISHAQKKDNSMKHDNSKLVEGCEDIKWHIQESPCLAKKHSSPKPINKTNLSNDSYTGVPNVVCGDSRKKSTSRAENSQTNVDSESLKDQAKSSSSGDRQSFQKLLPRFTNQSSSRSYGATAVSSSEDQRSTSKKTVTVRRDCMNKDAPDSPSARRLSSQKKQPNTSHLNIEKSTKPNCAVSSEDQIALIRNNATRRPAPKSEEVASTSSALTKLTNRLNFLKERRAQLANELQNLDFGRASGPEAPSKTNSS